VLAAYQLGAAQYFRCLRSKAKLAEAASEYERSVQARYCEALAKQGLNADDCAL
jgi:hypothetical protein